LSDGEIERGARIPIYKWEKSAGYPPDAYGVSSVETAKGPNTGALVLPSAELTGAL
jgi:hypothetical protein